MKQQEYHIQLTEDEKYAKLHLAVDSSSECAIEQETWIPPARRKFWWDGGEGTDRFDGDGGGVLSENEAHVVMSPCLFTPKVAKLLSTAAARQRGGAQRPGMDRSDEIEFHIPHQSPNWHIYHQPRL